MRVLDIDMDFFLNGRVSNVSRDAPRPVVENDFLSPWKEALTINFLESLQISSGTHHDIVTHHDEVFPVWRRLISEGILDTPFQVVHVDALSDLGMGFPSWPYLHTDFLELPLSDREYPRTGDEGLNFGNYLIFAVGNRWISEIDFVTNDSWHDDLPRLAFSDESVAIIDKIEANACLPKVSYDLELELMSITKDDVEKSIYAGHSDLFKRRKKCGEPTVHFRVHIEPMLPQIVTEGTWDYISVARSPSYVPESADHLLEIIRELMA